MMKQWLMRLVAVVSVVILPLFACDTQDAHTQAPDTPDTQVSDTQTRDTEAPVTEEAKSEHTAHPLLWKIEGEKPSYLFGTIHVPDSKVLSVHPDVTAALHGADAVYCELPMDKVSLTRSTGRMMLPSDSGLKKLLPEELYQRVDAFLASRGLNLAALDKLKIWAVEAQLVLLEDPTLMGGEPLDARLYAIADSLEKEVGGIETYDEQFEVFEAFTTEEQIESLEKTITSMEEAQEEGRSPIRELIGLYLEGDAQELMEYVNKEVDLDNPREARFLKLLLTDRNVRMADRSAEKLKENPDRSYFFAYGAAHMPGEDGVVELLRAKGYTVTRMHAPPTQ